MSPPGALQKNGQDLVGAREPPVLGRHIAHDDLQPQEEAPRSWPAGRPRGRGDGTVSLHRMVSERGLARAEFLHTPPEADPGKHGVTPCVVPDRVSLRPRFGARPPGCCAAAAPLRKNVPRAPCPSRISRSGIVVSGSGPSSKVRAMSGSRVSTWVITPGRPGILRRPLDVSPPSRSPGHPPWLFNRPSIGDSPDPTDLTAQLGEGGQSLPILGRHRPGLDLRPLDTDFGIIPANPGRGLGRGSPCTTRSSRAAPLPACIRCSTPTARPPSRSRGTGPGSRPGPGSG
jgi:hypothetical protein